MTKNLNDKINSYIHEMNISDSRIMDFRDELREDELKRKIIKLIEEHCEMGFREWEGWSDEYDENYPHFIQLMKIHQMDMLFGEYNI